MIEGEYESARALNTIVPNLAPRGAAWGQYVEEDTDVYFFLGDYHDMDLSTASDPTNSISQLVSLHTKSKSPTGMFGFGVPTALGEFERTARWESNWATCFTNQLRDVIVYDDQANGPWPEYDAACSVIPRLLSALQSGSRSIEPVPSHGDLWEQNVGPDKETGEVIPFDPCSTYAHNEMEFGTRRCSRAYHFNSPVYMRLYQRHVEPSEPFDEWDDRNRLYSLHPYLNDSAGHPGSGSRKICK
jgi:protein-ribulosamine 3-kinase